MFESSVFKSTKLAITIDEQLSDETRIGGRAWKKLKHEAMEDDYQSMSWYSDLLAGEQLLLEALRSAQDAQGDREHLEPQPYID